MKAVAIRVIGKMPSPNSHHNNGEKPHKPSFFHTHTRHRGSYSTTGSRSPDSHSLSLCRTQSSLSHQHPLSMSKHPDSLPNETIQKDFCDLYKCIISHVKTFYTTAPVGKGGATQTMIEQASTGLLLPWPQLLALLEDSKTRLGVLAMCIAGTIFSRSLLMRLGTTNTTGATFLPPEIVDCFQSFCIGKSVATLDGNEPNPLNYMVLVRWKQLSAMLLHSTYVDDAFSPFDGRTVNIERATKDLDPLLSTYAIPHDAGCEEGTRLTELRDVLRKGAKLAFTLFSQPCLWKFDWYSDRKTEVGEGQLEPRTAEELEQCATNSKDMCAKLTLAEIVVWPRLLRIMDEEGCILEGEGEGVVFGGKKFLNNFSRSC